MSITDIKIMKNAFPNERDIESFNFSERED